MIFNLCLQEGYARWELFRKKGLDLYAAHRNNALKRWLADHSLRTSPSLRPE